MPYRPFRNEADLLGEHRNFIQAYTYLQSENVPTAEDRPAMSLSILDHYKNCPGTPEFDNITLLNFAQKYTMPRVEGNEPSHRTKEVVV